MSAALAWREQVAAAVVCGSSSCVSLFIGWFYSWRGEFDIDIKADRAYDRPAALLFDGWLLLPDMPAASQVCGPARTLSRSGALLGSL